MTGGVLSFEQIQAVARIPLMSIPGAAALKRVVQARRRVRASNHMSAYTSIQDGDER